MRNSVIALLVTAAIGCGADVDLPDPGVDGTPSTDAGVDAYLLPLTGTWHVTAQECTSPDGACQPQWFDSAAGAVIDDGTGMIEWQVTGPTGMQHAFVRSVDCAVVPVGTDLGKARDGYTLCDHGDGVLEGTIGIARTGGGRDYWSVEMRRR